MSPPSRPAAAAAVAAFEDRILSPFFSHEKSLSFLHTTSESKGLSRKHKKYIFWSDAVSEAAAAAEAIEKKDEVGRRNED